MAQYIEINEDHPQPHRLEKVTDALRNGELIAYPTDSVYAIGCDIMNQKAIDKLCLLKGIKPGKAQFSFIFESLSQVADYSKQIDNQLFKLLKKTLPGPYTYIINANNKLPKLLQTKKKTMGVRIPNNEITRSLVKTLGNPIITTSIKDEDDIQEYFTDPWLIYEKFENQLAFVIDGGLGNIEASTVVDCTDGINVVREGLGDIYQYI